MGNALPQSGRLTLAPGVRVVRVGGPEGSAHEIIDDSRGVRLAVSAREAGFLNLIRGGVAVEEVTRRPGSEGALSFCQRLVAANLLIPVPARPVFLPDDYPKLVEGVRFYKSQTPGMISCVEPRSGRKFTMRDVDALIAGDCDGQHTVLDICDAAQNRGVPATLQTMVSFLRELDSMGCLEGSAAPSQAPGRQITKTALPKLEAPPPDLADADDGFSSKTVVAPLPGPPGPSASASVTKITVAPKTRPSGEQKSRPSGEQRSRPAAPQKSPAKEEDLPSSASGSKLEALRSLSLDKGEEPRPVAGRSGLSRLAGFVAFAMVVAFGGYQWWARRNEARMGEPQTAALRTQVVMPETPANRSLVAAGYIAARTPITLGVTTSGRVKTLLVDEGDQVKKNQLLAQLDDSEALAQMRLSMAKAHDAQRSLSRVKAMFAAQAATATDLEKAQGQVEIASAEVSVNRQQVDQMKVRSPINGTVIERLVRPGEVITVAPNSTVGVVKLGDLSDLVAEIDVNEPDVPLVQRGQQADVTADMYPDKRYRGTVHEIAPQADRAKGIVRVKVDLRVKDGSLKPGMAVRAAFDTSPGTKPRLLLPRQAVIDGSVWVVSSRGTAERRAVDAQPAGPDVVDIVTGLTPGERVVIEAAASLRPGQHVE